MRRTRPGQAPARWCLPGALARPMERGGRRQFTGAGLVNFPLVEAGPGITACRTTVPDASWANLP